MDRASSRTLRLTVRPSLVSAVMVGVLVLLWVPGMVGALAGPDGTVGAVLRQVDYDREGNLAAAWQGLTLLALAVIAAVTAAAAPRGRERLEWIGIAAVFAFVSADEATAIHELLISPLIDLTGASGVLHFAWLIPALVILVALAGLYLPWYLRLDPRLRLRLTLALGLYLLGAVVGEMIGGALYESGGETTLAYRLEAQLEELCEALGVVVAVRGLLEDVGRRGPELAIAVAPSAAPQAVARRRNLIGRDLETRSPPA